jgi:hypothetical protein
MDFLASLRNRSNKFSEIGVEMEQLWKVLSHHRVSHNIFIGAIFWLEIVWIIWAEETERR